MHFHLRIHRWVFWWFWLGVTLGAIAIANIVFRDMPRRDEDIVLIAGIVFWSLGGIACYAVEGIRFEKPSTPPESRRAALTRDAQPEWHAASDFLLPGNRKSILKPRY